jgi:hypothetical protein
MIIVLICQYSAGIKIGFIESFVHRQLDGMKTGQEAVL